MTNIIACGTFKNAHFYLKGSESGTDHLSASSFPSAPAIPRAGPDHSQDIGEDQVSHAVAQT